MWGLSKSERRRHGAEMLYGLETGFREDGWPSEEFVYDAERDLYRSRMESSPSSGSTPTSGGCGRWASSGNLCQASFKIPA
jgi:hypothetical protein